MNKRIDRWLPAIGVVLALLPGSCGPDESNTSADIPARGESPGPYTPFEPQYQKENPRVAVDDDPCEGVDVYGAREDFGQVYEIEGRPRLAILANVLNPNLGGRDDARPTLASELSRPEAVPVDRATVENECIAFFNSTSERMRIVDVAVARTSMASATNPAGVLEGFRRIDLCDIAIMIEVRVSRVEPSQEQPTNPERFTVACTARVSKVLDGHILATSTQERTIQRSEPGLDRELRRLSLCLAADMANKLIEVFTRPRH